MSTIYLASSWRNPMQPDAVTLLRQTGHAVYDFRNPVTRPTSTDLGDDSGGLQWTSIDPAWEHWSPWSFRQALGTDAAQAGFAADWTAMRSSGTCVLLLPCGRSAHLEAGYFVGHPDKRLFIVAPELPEPELMYLMADGIYLSLTELLEAGVL